MKHDSPDPQSPRAKYIAALLDEVEARVDRIHALEKGTIAPEVPRTPPPPVVLEPGARVRVRLPDGVPYTGVLVVEHRAGGSWTVRDDAGAARIADPSWIEATA